MRDILAELEAKGVDAAIITELRKWKASHEREASRLAKARKRQRDYWERHLTSLTSVTSETRNANEINKALTSGAPSSFIGEKSSKKEKKDGRPIDEKAELYRRGHDVLGEGSGGMITKLIERKGTVGKARAALELASEAGVPKQYIGKIITAGNGRFIP